MSTILILIAIAITTLAQILVSASYARYKKVKGSKNLTGYDVARKILDSNGLNNVMIYEVSGNLSDHYDPSKKTVSLSHDIYAGTSIASLAVAAHECGHAIQDKESYTPMRIRSAIVPTVNIFTRIGYLVIVIGFAFSYKLVEVGIILLLSMLAFQLITLPVEFNASHRALKQIEKLSLSSSDEKKKARRMLIAAAFTYVAALLSTLLEILRYVVILNARKR